MRHFLHLGEPFAPPQVDAQSNRQIDFLLLLQRHHELSILLMQSVENNRQLDIILQFGTDRRELRQLL